MKKSARLKPVRDLKHQAERAEAKKLGELQKQLLQARKQCEELKGYLQDYYKSIEANRQNVRQAAQLGLYQAFISRLQDAIQYQTQVIKQRETVILAQSKKWHEASQRLKTLDDLIERSRRQEELDSDKREQKIQDDRPFRSGGGFE